MVLANGLYTYIFNRAPPLLTQSAVCLLCPQRGLRGLQTEFILESLGPLYPNLVLVIYFILIGGTTVLPFIQTKTLKVIFDSFFSLTFCI